MTGVVIKLLCNCRSSRPYRHANWIEKPHLNVSAHYLTTAKQLRVSTTSAPPNVSELPCIVTGQNVTRPNNTTLLWHIQLITDAGNKENRFTVLIITPAKHEARGKKKQKDVLLKENRTALS